MVNVPYKKTAVYDALTDEYEIFEYYFDAIMFMAILGYRHDIIKTDSSEYLGDEDERGSIGIERFHDRNHYHAIVAALAYQKTGDPSAMADPDVHREVIPQYAAGGLEIYEQEFGDVAGDPTDALATHITSVVDEESVTREDDELEKIIRIFDDEMFN